MAVTPGTLATWRTRLTLTDTALSARLLWSWAAIAYGAGMLARYAVHVHSDAGLLRGPDGHRALTTIDAYYYATGLKRALTGLLSDYERVPTALDSGLVALCALVGKSFGLHSSDLAYFFPVLAGPLLLFALLAWTRVLQLPRLALFAALPVAIGYSYLNRTSPGQFDTDVFAVTIPYAALAAVAAAIDPGRTAYATIAGLLIATSSYFHPGAERVLLACSGVALLYVLAAHRSRAGAQLLLTLALALAPLPIPARVALVLTAHVLLPRFALGERAFLLVASCTLAAVGCMAALQTEVTILTGGHSAVDGLHFYDVRGEVAELRVLPLKDMTARVCGGPLPFALACVGLVGLTVSRPRMLLLWPLFLLGTVGSELRGLRFTIYAVPAAALGLAWLAAQAVELVQPAAARRTFARVATLLAVALLAYPAITHASHLKLPATYKASELSLMGELARRVQPGDYALAWWDQAYGLWYYAGVRTLVDGMKQDEDLFVVAESIFGQDQRLAARLARNAVERIEARDAPRPVIRKLLAEAAASGLDPDAYLSALSNGSVAVAQRTREIYLFMPSRIAAMASVWSRARKIEGTSSRGEEALGFIDSGRVEPSRTSAVMFSGRRLDMTRWELLGPAGQRTRIANTLTPPSAPGSKDWRREVRHPGAPLHALMIPDGSTLVVDDKMLRSNYLQLAAFEKNLSDAFVPAATITRAALYRIVP